MEKALFDIKEMGGVGLDEVIDAYYCCRHRKRRTVNSMRFEINWEAECVQLWQDINDGSYKPGRSIAFIVEKPVKREVFAADFRDRVVHHLIANKITPLLEKQFIRDSYSTRKEKGTLDGIRRISEQIRQVSANYTEDCYVMKLDIEGFFMSIQKAMLYQEISDFVNARYQGNDKQLLLELIRLTVMNRPEKNCVRKSPRKAWKGLSMRKTLFGTDGTVGLPIGNLTSQLLALLHLDPLDHLILGEWGIEGYGRYVDDMVLIDHSEQVLLRVRHSIDHWLRMRGHRLHSRKFYLQHYRKGVLFIGSMIRPGRELVGHRTLSFCMMTIHGYNQMIEKGGKATEELSRHFRDSMNSYLGMMQQFKSYNMVHVFFMMFSQLWYRSVHVVGKNGKYKLIMV